MLPFMVNFKFSIETYFVRKFIRSSKHNYFFVEKNKTKELLLLRLPDQSFKGEGVKKEQK